MERKIGEVFTYNGKTYQVVPDYGCENCDFKDLRCNIRAFSEVRGACDNSMRKDNNNVIFKEIKDMDNFWKLATCALLVFSISMVIGSNNLSNQIEELQTTVDRQTNAIQQLEREKNNTETTIPQYLDSLSGGD